MAQTRLLLQGTQVMESRDGGKDTERPLEQVLQCHDSVYVGNKEEFTHTMSMAFARSSTTSDSH